MTKHLTLLMLALISPSLLGQTIAPNVEPGTLQLVIGQVTSALHEYQENRGSGATNELPPLTSAEFDFRASTASTAGFSLNLLIFKFGTSHETDVVNDVTYTYALPAPKVSGLQGSHEPPALKDELARTIQSAAKAVKGSAVAAGLPFSKLTVNIQYGVKWDVSASGQVTYSLVTVGLSGDKNKNTVQSVKLTFGK